MKNSEKHLHILSFDVPFPPNYGGVINVYFKLKSLKQQGVKIHLHSYQYGREESRELEQLCYKVHYYKRKIYKDPFFGKLPYIVSTRNSGVILDNLMQDDYPVLFEGLHTCYYLGSDELAKRCKVVRMHNIEHVYYKYLSKLEPNLFKRYFFHAEARKLRKFEKNLKKSSLTAAISPADHQYLDIKYKNSFYLPVFHPNEEVNIQLGTGEFALYHGNLSVGENNEAAMYLIHEVFNDLDYPLVIAGMRPSKELKLAVQENPNIKLLATLSSKQILQLIQQAQINILPTAQNTGIKLKLINVLFKGRHCLVNDKMVMNTGLEDLCVIANTPREMKRMVNKLKKQPMDDDQITMRREILMDNFCNTQNAQKLVSRIYD